MVMRVGIKRMPGRVVMLLRATTPNNANNGTINDNGGTPQHYIGGPAISGGLPLAPLEAGTIDYSGGANTFATASAESPTPANPAPRNPPYLIHESRYDLAGWDASLFKQNLNAIIAANGDWWSRLMLDCRFQCNPFVAGPLTSASMAKQSPYFVGHCSQFIVEYAGDFIAQQPATLANGALNPDAWRRTASMIARCTAITRSRS